MEKQEIQGLKDKIFVGGLDYSLQEEDFRMHFEAFGKVIDAQIVRDPITGTSRGFGFITYEKESIARKLINEIQTTQINGRQVDIRTAEPKLSEKIAMINKSIKEEKNQYKNNDYVRKRDYKRNDKENLANERDHSNKEDRSECSDNKSYKNSNMQCDNDQSLTKDDNQNNSDENLSKKLQTL